MLHSDIRAHVDMTVVRHAVEAHRRGPHARRLAEVLHLREQFKNIVHRAGVLDYVKYVFSQTAGAPGASRVHTVPWRVPTQFDGLNLNTRLCPPVGGGSAGIADYNTYDFAFSGSDSARGRATTPATSYTAASNLPQVLGSLLVNTASQGGATAANGGGLAHIDVATTQIGVPYGHPVSGTINGDTTVGLAYLANFTAFDVRIYSGPVASGSNYLRILSGADKGIYRIRYLDRVNSRVYLQNLDGTPFAAQATAASVPLVIGPLRSWFNQGGVIPNSTGTVTTDGVFAPGENRSSYTFRLFFEKSGSPSPADPSQTGAYWFTIRPFHQGTGSEVASESRDRDTAGILTGHVGLFGNGGFVFTPTAGFTGGCPGFWLDRTRQRLWGATTGGSVFWWLYKSCESFHEVATASGTPNDPISGPVLTGTTPTGLDGGSDDTVYVALSVGANAGVVAFKTDLTATQWLASSASLGANVRLKVDRSRARSGGANTVTTGAGTANLTCSDGAFTDADIGRAIRITSGADAGTYKIATRSSGTQVTVQTTAGAAVSFTGQAATGSWQIGDRIYLFWASDTSSMSARMVYMESLAFGTVMTQAVTMTNGAQIPTAVRAGDLPAVGIDQTTGAVYWNSTDTTNYINRYDPSTRTVTQKTLASFTTPTGGTGTISTPTAVRHIAVNPHASFPEVWVSTDQGLIKWASSVTDLTTLLAASGNYARYTGTGSDATPYSNPSGYARTLNATWGSTNDVRQVHFGLDGSVYAIVCATGTATFDIVRYVRDSDLCTTAVDTNTNFNLQTGAFPGYLFSPYGEVVWMNPQSVNNYFGYIGTYEIAYQWTGAAWVPKDVVRGSLPDATSSPGLTCKALHTTAQDLLFGVKVKFTPQGGATPANNEFMGRMGLTGAARADGASTTGVNTFGGSGFSAADVGRYLRIESGADVGVYNIATFVNANQVTLRKVSNAAWTATATAGSLTYTVWDPGSFGQECVTVTAFNGFGRDNTQDITNIVVEYLVYKSVLSTGVESVKPACGIVGPTGSAGISVFWESYARTTNPNYSPGIPQGLALPGGALANGDQLLAGMLQAAMNGTVGRASTVPDTSFFGRAANAATTGFAVSLDLGCDVEVGTVIVRGTSNGDPPLILNTENQNAVGLIANLHAAAESGGAPAAASSVRVSGTGLSIGTGAFSATVTGDFLGAVAVSASDGITVSGGNTITSAAGRFTGREGQVVRLTSGSDLGYYRVVSVNIDGSIATCQPLAQGTLAFIASASGLSFSIYDNAVREEDILAVPNAAGAHKLCVERLTAPNAAQVRISPSATLTTQNWECLRPTWNLVKRASHSALATVPDTFNNGTYHSTDGQENAANDGGWKVVFDLSDLASAKRTGRYWKFSGMPRYSGGGSPTMSVNAVELYGLDGKRIEWLPSNRVDTVESQPQFMAMHLLRADWIQGANDAASHVAGTNGLATIGGTAGETITLAGANRFLGYQVRNGALGAIPGGDGTFNIGADPNFTVADVTRILRIISGVNAGYYRVATVPSGTQVTLTTINGAAVTLTADAGPVTWALHEGFNAGVSLYDYIFVNNVERQILAISDDLKTITTAYRAFESASGLTWEIRRRGVPSSASTADATVAARVLYAETAYARQSGDVVQGHKGGVGFYSLDVGTPVARADGTAAGGSAVFNGSAFTPDDVGRILTIAAGPNRGNYQISVYTNATTISLKNPRTGSAVTLSADATPRSYRVLGERRLRFSRYVTALRQ